MFCMSVQLPTEGTYKFVIQIKITVFISKLLENNQFLLFLNRNQRQGYTFFQYIFCLHSVVFIKGNEKWIFWKKIFISLWSR